MDPGTAAIGLMVASAASTGLGLVQSRQQEKLELASLQLEAETAKTQATDEALVRAKSFREALASQLAISSLRGGTGGSLVRQFGAVSVSNFLKDQDVLGKRQQYIDIATSLNRASITSGRFGRDISSIGGLVQSGFGAMNLNALGSK